MWILIITVLLCAAFGTTILMAAVCNNNYLASRRSTSSPNPRGQTLPHPARRFNLGKLLVVNKSIEQKGNNMKKMEDLANELTEALAKIESVCGKSDYGSAGIEVKRLGNGGPVVPRFTHWNGEDHTHRDTLDELVHDAIKKCGPKAKLEAASRLRQQAEKLEREAAELEGK